MNQTTNRAHAPPRPCPPHMTDRARVPPCPTPRHTRAARAHSVQALSRQTTYTATPSSVLASWTASRSPHTPPLYCTRSSSSTPSLPRPPMTSTPHLGRWWPPRTQRGHSSSSPAAFYPCPCPRLDALKGQGHRLVLRHGSHGPNPRAGPPAQHGHRHPPNDHTARLLRQVRRPHVHTDGVDEMSL
jgi:hypothetical protein